MFIETSAKTGYNVKQVSISLMPTLSQQDESRVNVCVWVWERSTFVRVCRLRCSRSSESGWLSAEVEETQNWRQLGFAFFSIPAHCPVPLSLIFTPSPLTCVCVCVVFGSLCSEWVGKRVQATVLYASQAASTWDIYSKNADALDSSPACSCMNDFLPLLCCYSCSSAF